MEVRYSDDGFNCENRINFFPLDFTFSQSLLHCNCVLLWHSNQKKMLKEYNLPNALLHHIFFLENVYLKNPISFAGHTKTLPCAWEVTWRQETTFNPSILLPGVAPPTAPPMPLHKHKVWNNRGHACTNGRYLSQLPNKGGIVSNTSRIISFFYLLNLYLCS